MRLARGAAERLRRAPNDEPHVAVFCDWFLRYGSAQAVALRSTGTRVTLYYADRLGEFGGLREDRELFLDHARRHGVEVVQVPVRSMARLPLHVFSILRDLRARRITAAVVQQHYDPRFGVASLAVPAALLLHDPQPHSGEETNLPRRGRAMARLAEATASAIVLHSDRLRPQVRPFLRDHPVAIVPHGAAVQPEPAPLPARRELLLFGRLFPYKGVEVALEAFELVRRSLPDATLTVAGEGPLGKAIAERLPDGVALLDGYVDERRLDELLAGSRLVLLPYLDATQSGVGLRAVAAGIPCVVTAEGALPDLVPPELESFVIPSGDAESLAAAILAHVDHDAAVRTAFHAHASRRLDWPVVGQVLLDELRRLGLVSGGSAGGQKHARA